MGYDIVAYFDVNQEQIEDFIVEQNINRDNWKQGLLVVEYYKRENPDMKYLNMIYNWNEECQLHEFFDSYGTNFIRDDERFSMDGLPYCLSCINHNIHTSEDVIEIAEALEEYFPEDHHLASFADWLRTTAKHCNCL
jgi:hypothetical protein